MTQQTHGTTPRAEPPSRTGVGWRLSSRAHWLVAWSAGLLFVFWVERNSLSAALDGGLPVFLAGINIDTVPAMFWLVLGIPLALFRFPRGSHPSGRSSRLSDWWNASAGETGGCPLKTVAVVSLLAALSLWSGWFVSTRVVRGPGRPTFGSLPPAFHDEYSYLYQAGLFARGEWTGTGHPTAPRLFDQMHVLNDNGVMASRYFPGVAAWMAPWVAMGHPAWGHLLAGMLTTVFVFGIGRELSSTGVGVIAGLLTALSPGLALFSNLLLSHHPTMMGLSVFVFAFLRMDRTGHVGLGYLSGGGLALAMLCRPLTAAAVGLPFGCWLAWWWLRRDGIVSTRQKSARVVAVCVPLAIGLLVTMWHNNRLTGDWTTTPYQVYTDQFTPRHVFGFNNVKRGEQRIAAMDEAAQKRVLQHYDQWAENLDADLAVRNVISRVVESGKWTVGIVVLLVTAVALLSACLLGHRALPGRHWTPIVLSIVCLHVAHVPYWYAGIMNWHYVFESGPLYALVVAGATTGLFDVAQQADRPQWSFAWVGLLLMTPLTAYTECDPLWSVSRLDLAVGEVGFARARHADFLRLVQEATGDEPCLVLVEADPADRHFDLVVNDANPSPKVLIGRYTPQQVPISHVLDLFPSRRVFVFHAAAGRLRAIRRGQR